MTKLRVPRSGSGDAGADALGASPRSGHGVRWWGCCCIRTASKTARLAPRRGRQANLVVTMDDATSALSGLLLVDQEGTASSLRRDHEVIKKQGLFCSLYTDRGSHYFETREAGAGVSKTVLTQFGRALKQLGIEHIAAYSPQARGRSERVFGTLQDRLPKELAMLGITTVEAANDWLREVYMPDHNARFAIAAEQERRHS